MAPIYKGKKQPTMFAAADNRTHARIRRPVAGAYAMTSIMQFEPFVDENIRVFYARMEELFIGTRRPCDIHNWVQYCELLLTTILPAQSMLTSSP